MRVPGFLRKALAAAYSATETKDAIDAIYKALPKHIREKTKKSGRTRRGSRLPPGTPYSTTHDKALAIYLNFEQLDLQAAARNLLTNHVEDAVLGRLFGGSDQFARDYLHGNRLLNIG